MLTFDEALAKARKAYELESEKVWRERELKLAQRKESCALKMQERFNQLKRN